MTEPEILFPIKCPICSQEMLTGFRISIVEDALDSGDIRLYANCHLASWDASAAELEQIRNFLDATGEQ
jgi:methionyl-tRNA formyltransferase